MPIWPFGSNAPRSDGPKLQDEAFSDLSRMFLSNPQNPTPGSELLEVSRLDFSVESLRVVDDHLNVMRGRSLQGKDMLCFVLRAGAYVGEVIRRHAAPGISWHWIDYEQAVAISPGLSQFGKGIGTVAVLWDGKKGFIFPLAKVGKFLQNGPEDSVRFYAHVIIASPPPAK
jgi:hypothetical protein